MFAHTLVNIKTGVGFKDVYLISPVTNKIFAPFF